MSLYVSRGEKFSRTVPFEVVDLRMGERWMAAQFAVDVEHDPGQSCAASRCYYDSPPDPPETTVTAVCVVGWTEYDCDGNELPKVLTEQQVIEACRSRIDEHAADLFT